MILGTLILACIFFIEAFLFLEMSRDARGIVARAREALRVIADRTRSDEEKERCTRAASAVILKSTAVLVMKLAAIAAVLAAIFYGTILLSPESRHELVATLASPAVFASLTVAALGYVWMRNALLRQI